MTDRIVMDEGRSILSSRHSVLDNGNIPAVDSDSALERRRNVGRIGRRIGGRSIAMRDVSILGAGSARFGLTHNLDGADVACTVSILGRPDA